MDLSHPADRRRFPAYARSRGIPFEIARPDRSYDLVVLSEIADLKTWSSYRAGKVVYDLIDSYLAVPRSDPKQLLRGIAWYSKGFQRQPVLDFRGALERMCRRADAVVCTTIEQQQTISSFCPNVHIALDLHDELIRSVKTDYRAGRPFKLIWEGLPCNVYQLATIRDALREVSGKHPIQLVLLTDLEQKRAIPWLGRVRTLDMARRIFDHVRVVPWEQASWSDTITQADLAVIPIDMDNRITAGKPGNKLALLWRAGIPVVTSATPSYARMLEAVGLSQLACRDTAQWIAALDQLIGSEEARARAGTLGRQYVERVLTKAAQLQAWDEVLTSIGIEVPKEVARF
ncbi:hypothetical protein [Bradyrhizobium sp. Ai1a-2]|uniref:hypothetical protein n=1 Tax=Bradyrhizobium sp. Ai1a-2 TaxID=196490 RepID=UPI00041AA197|nr:hypothetical protein [Bradyrhizobium sp. Ai1a-2]